MKRSAVIGIASVLLAAACARPAGVHQPKASAAPKVPEVPYELRLGRGVYVHYCATCHGDGGAGDGFNAFNLNPRPRDLSDAAYQKSKTDAELADAVRRGGTGVGLSALMPPWGNTLSRRQVDEVVLYMRSLAKKQQGSVSK